VQSLVGTFTLERAYYHCRSCGKGTVPWDEVLDLSRQALTPGASEAICVAGTMDSFGEAAEVVLKKLAGLRVSESTVQRTSEAVGHDIGTYLAAGEIFGAPWSTWRPVTQYRPPQGSSRPTEAVQEFVFFCRKSLLAKKLL